jgi:hypothetical chaperone protein
METTIRFHEAGIEIDEPLTRAELEALIEADVAEVRRCMDGVIASAGVAPAAVESVFLTGGSAQIPALRRIFEATFGADRLRAQDYLTTVACGLALSDV